MTNLPGETTRGSFGPWRGTSREEVIEDIVHLSDLGVGVAKGGGRWREGEDELEGLWVRSEPGGRGNLGLVEVEYGFWGIGEVGENVCGGWREG